MKTVTIIQARMTSSRLPGKVLKEVLGKPLLEYQLERIQQAKISDEIVVATTTKRSDHGIVDLCKRLSVPYFCGPEEDVLARYYHAAKAFKAEVIVRVTADCPLIDPKIISKVINSYYFFQGEKDYASNCIIRSYPRGMDAEVFSFKVLSEAHTESTNVVDRENVTPFIYRQPDRYKLLNVSHSHNLSSYRFTVDYYEDYVQHMKIIEHLTLGNPMFTLDDIMKVATRHGLLLEDSDWKTISLL